MERETGFEPATYGLEGHRSSQLSYSRTLGVPSGWSGRKDLNLRPLAPHASALAGLRHAPNRARLYTVLKELTIVLGYSSLVMKALAPLLVEAFECFEF